MLLGCISPSNCLCETVHVPGVQRERACAAARTRGGASCVRCVTMSALQVQFCHLTRIRINMTARVVYFDRCACATL